MNEIHKFFVIKMMIWVFFVASVFKALTGCNWEMIKKALIGKYKPYVSTKKYDTKEIVQLWFINKETQVLILPRLLACKAQVALSYIKS